MGVREVTDTNKHHHLSVAIIDEAATLLEQLTEARAALAAAEAHADVLAEAVFEARKDMQQIKERVASDRPRNGTLDFIQSSQVKSDEALAAHHARRAGE